MPPAHGTAAVATEAAVVSHAFGRDWLASLVEFSPLGCAVLSAALQPLYANPALARVLGRNPLSADGSHRPLFAAHDAARAHEELAAALSGGSPSRHFEVDLLGHDGRPIAARVTVVCFDHDGDPLLQLHLEVDREGRSLARIADNERRLGEQQAALLALARRRTNDCTLEELLAYATRLSARVLDCERVGVWLFSDERDAIVCADLYASPQDEHQSGQRVGRAVCPAYFRALDENLVIKADAALSDERTRELAHSYLRPLGIGAMLDTPIRAGGMLLGVVCHEHTGSTRRWLDGEVAFAEAVASWVALCMQLAQRDHAERRLRASEKRYRELFDAAPVSLWEEDWSVVKRMLDAWREAGATDLEAFLEAHPHAVREACAAVRVLDVNQSTLDIYGAADKSSFLTSVRARLRTESFPGFQRRLVTLAAGARHICTEDRERRLNGQHYDARITVEIPEAYASDWSRVFASIEDMTEARDLSRRLSYEASHDGLTDLTNRRAFERDLDLALEDLPAPGHEHVLCYLDLDQFKVVNDRCGHVAGDQLLREIAGILREHVSRRDTLARLGGDEFALLLHQCGIERAGQIAEDLRAAVETYRFAWDGRLFNVRVSIGVVAVSEHCESLTAVLAAADAACYAAKDEGRNTVYVYRPGAADMVRRHGEMEWATVLDAALREDRLKLFRQAIRPTDANESDWRHYEILVRLVAPDGALVAPGAFLPAAERFGLAERLDSWVVKATLAWLQARPEHVSDLKMCSINLSGQSIGRDGFMHSLGELLQHHRVPASKLCFEITETAAISDLARAVSLMHELRGLGCSVALDDFGSGLSSFGYLKTLPADFVKIDGLFVRDIVDDPIDLAMVRSINDIGHVMGKRTIAEFVENDRILELLRDIGVDLVQGYGVGKPTPVEND